MLSIIRFFSCLLLALSLIAAGCATAPPSDAPKVPPSAQPAQDKGRIVFYRSNGFFGYGMRTDILLDGTVVGRSAPGTKFYVDVAPGAHRVTVPNRLYGGERTLDVTLQKADIIYVRTAIGGASFVGFTDVDLIGTPEGTQEAVGLELVY